MHCPEGQEREREGGRKITCRCHSAATFLCISLEKKNKKRRKNKHKVAGNVLRLPGHLSETSKRAKGHDKCCKSHEQNPRTLEKQDEALHQYLCPTAIGLKVVAVPLPRTLSPSLSTVLTVSLTLFIPLLYIPHSFGYSRYRVPLVRCRRRLLSCLSLSALSPSLTVCLSLFLLPIFLLPSACPWSISRSRGTINCVTNATWQLK